MASSRRVVALGTYSKGEFRVELSLGMPSEMSVQDGMIFKNVIIEWPVQDGMIFKNVIIQWPVQDGTIFKNVIIEWPV